MSDSVPDNLARRLDEMDEQFEAIASQLLDPEVLGDHTRVRALSIKRAALEGPVLRWREVRRIEAESSELEEAIQAGEDEELIGLAREELPALKTRRMSLIEAVKTELVTAEDKAVGAMILEIRAGVGGDEAGIWAGDLLEMYQRYAGSRGWSFEILDLQPGEKGGAKSVIAELEGEGAWSELGYEGGTHQVKRVPATEAQGRIHTSTATVAVLAQPEEVAVELDRSDVKESITTAQGPGGQNVNKVATAVHLIHQPTGIEVRMQETKSQAQNREKAWRLLRARLYERQQKELDEKRARERASMIGSGGRAEKIRTYRYKENLAVDHRLGSSFNLGELMQGRMTPLVEALIELDVARRLAAL
ncbi:MAG: PCRF domain-containing protein [Phycisphaerales bacterium]|nr:PCRF domain-containing protein [Phycisphaerales bacterium]